MAAIARRTILKFGYVRREHRHRNRARQCNLAKFSLRRNARVLVARAEEDETNQSRPSKTKAATSSGMTAGDSPSPPWRHLLLFLVARVTAGSRTSRPHAG